MKVIITENQYNQLKKNIAKDEYLKQYFYNTDETINEFQSSTSFDVNTLKSLHSFKKRLDYCKANLKPINISGGSSRAVFAFGNDKVIKLAKNEKGIAQNSVESDGYLQHSPIIPKLYDNDDYDLYVVMELAKLIRTPRRFEELTGVKWDDISNWSLTGYNYIENLNQKYITGQDDYNEFVFELVDLIQSMDLAQGDLKKLNSYGEVMRESTPIAVIIDCGLTNHSWKEYYS